MEWSQTLAIIATLIGATFTFFKLTRDEISVIREDMKRMDAHHREDMQKMDEKIDRMDAKWERLFERLLIQDQQKNK